MCLDLTSRAESLLKDDMCICLDDLKNHLTESAPNSVDFFKEFFDFLATLQPIHQVYETGSTEWSENREYLNHEIISFCQSRHIPEDSNEYDAVDSLRQAFVSYIEGGVYGLYKGREALANWYPRVIFRKKICEHSLSGEIDIYRGTGELEYGRGMFGQSWTLDINVAHRFAFTHYRHGEHYENTQRVVLKSTISAENIYAYKQYPIQIQNEEILFSHMWPAYK